MTNQDLLTILRSIQEVALNNKFSSHKRLMLVLEMLQKSVEKVEYDAVIAVPLAADKLRSVERLQIPIKE